MARTMTSYAQPMRTPEDEQDDEIARQLLAENLAPQAQEEPPQPAEPAVAEPSPAAATEPDPKPVAAPAVKPPASAWEALAMGRGGDDEPRRPVNVPQPPMRESRSDWGMGLALVADLFLNKGRNAGQFIGAMSQPDDTAYDNYQRKMQHEKDLASIENKRNGPGDNPLAWMRYEQSQRRLDAQLAEQQRKADLERSARDPNSEASKRAVEAASKLYPQLADKFAGASQYELEKAGYLREAYAGQREGYRDKDFVRQAHEFDRREGTRQENRFDMADYQEGKKLSEEGRDAARKEEARQVFGYTRAEGAPKIGENEAKAIRETAAAVSTLEDAIDELAKLDESITPAQRALGKAGLTSEQVAMANEWQQEIASAIRKIANFGTPQAAELAITYARIPAVASVDGWLNGAAKYRAMKTVMRKRVDSELRAQGYMRDNAGGGSAPKTTQRTVTTGDAGKKAPTVDDLFE